MKEFKLHKGILFVTLIVSFLSCKKDADFIVTNLTCENLENPVGINTLQPGFSWVNRSSRQRASQTAYQILVASEKHLLSEKDADYWNSGKIESDVSLFVQYQGKSLIPGQFLYWKVRTWDENGNATSWSDPAYFGIGLLTEKDWQASYIGLKTEGGYRECPQFHNSFNVEEKGAKIILHVNSLGYHEAYLNGKKIGNGVLTPAVTQFGKRSLVNSYDISGQVKKGQNDLMLWLGSGWYTHGLPGVTNNGPVVRAQIEKIKNDKKETILVTDFAWVGRISSYTRHGNWRPQQFGGEIVNGAMAKNDLVLENNVERIWRPVSLIDVPKHEVSPQMVEWNIVADTIQPAEIVTLSNDTFLIDMGKNLTGWVEINFPELKESQEIKVEYCDHLDNNGRFVNQSQTDYYIAAGEGAEIFKNKFNYHAFRYIRISNINETPDIKSVKAYFIHTGYKMASSFECSDPDLNKIHDMIFYTLRCVSLGGYLVDCPHLERLGYGGDGNASTVTAQTMFNLGPLYSNWLQAWADVIRDDGGMPHTAPNPYRAGGGPYWTGFIINASWNSYINYGDSRILEKYYPVMQKWLGYVDKYTVGGLLKRWPDTDYRGWYLGDWAAPSGVDLANQNSVDLITNCYISVCFDQMEKIAVILGKTGDAKLYSEKREKLNQKILDTFYNESEHSFVSGSQIDLMYPMLAGVVPNNQLSDVTATLLENTQSIHQGHIACGLVGIPVMMEWATKSNHPDFIYSMLKKTSYPGYLHMLENGATTTWEHWNGERSRIHNCYNGVGSWFYQALGGIRPAEDVPGYRKVQIQPQIPEGVTWAKTFKETPFGKLSLNWNLKNEILELELKIPVGMETEVILPDGVKKYIMEGAKQELPDGMNGVKVKSGTYKISYKI
jgi:alpha-L-rhamnosidase